MLPEPTDMVLRSLSNCLKAQGINATDQELSEYLGPKDFNRYNDIMASLLCILNLRQGKLTPFKALRQHMKPRMPMTLTAREWSGQAFWRRADRLDKMHVSKQTNTVIATIALDLAEDYKQEHPHVEAPSETR